MAAMETTNPSPWATFAATEATAEQQQTAASTSATVQQATAMASAAQAQIEQLTLAGEAQATSEATTWREYAEQMSDANLTLAIDEATAILNSVGATLEPPSDPSLETHTGRDAQDYSNYDGTPATTDTVALTNIGGSVPSDPGLANTSGPSTPDDGQNTPDTYDDTEEHLDDLHTSAYDDYYTLGADDANIDDFYTTWYDDGGIYLPIPRDKTPDFLTPPPKDLLEWLRVNYPEMALPERCDCNTLSYDSNDEPTSRNEERTSYWDELYRDDLEEARERSTWWEHLWAAITFQDSDYYIEQVIEDNEDWYDYIHRWEANPNIGPDPFAPEARDWFFRESREIREAEYDQVACPAEAILLISTAGRPVISRLPRLPRLPRTRPFRMDVAPKGPVRGAPTNIGPMSSKGLKNVTPGIPELEGHYVNDLRRVEPWRAHYDEFGRLSGRTDYNAGNLTDGIPDVHYHRYQYNSRFPLGREIESHVPGEFPN